MKHILIPALMLACAAPALAGTDSDAVTLPEMKATIVWHDDAVVSPVLPVYPMEMRRAGLEGRVRVDIQVDRSGRVSRVRVLETENTTFADAVRDAVRQWRFVPDSSAAAREHRHARLTVRFVLDEAA